MKKTHSIPVKFEVHQYKSIKRRATTRKVPASAIVREAYGIAEPWLDHPPANSIAKESLQALSVLQGVIRQLTHQVTLARQAADQVAQLPRPDTALFAPLARNLAQTQQKAEECFREITLIINQLAVLLPLSYPVLSKLKDLAKTQRRLTLDAEEQAMLDTTVHALDRMGVA